MPAKIFKKYRYDISLQDGTAAHLVTWVTGLMVFFMTLMLAVNFGLNNMTDQWVTGLTGSLTVEIPPPSQSENPQDASKALDENVNKILWMAKQHKSVADARALTKSEIQNLIEPWLGEKVAYDLPLPALIDLKLTPDADTMTLQKDIHAIIPNATIDTHDDTLDDVQTLVKAIRGFVLLLTSIITALAIVSISGIVNAKFSIHKDEADILHLLGANDEYIAQQFRHHTLQGTLKGAIIGVILMTVTLLIMGSMTSHLNLAILPQVHIPALYWLVLIFAPIAVGALIAHITAQITVMRSLSKMP